MNWPNVIPVRDRLAHDWRSIFLWTLSHMNPGQYRNFWLKFQTKWNSTDDPKQQQVIIDSTITWIKGGLMRFEERQCSECFAVEIQFGRGEPFKWRRFTHIKEEKAYYKQAHCPDCKPKVMARLLRP